MKKNLRYCLMYFMGMLCLLLNMRAMAQSPRHTRLSLLVNKEYDELIALYQQLHAHPELSLQENETAKRMAAELERVGCQVTTGIGGNGVAGVLRNGKGPVIWVRTDMDALPIAEKTNVAYASKVMAINKDGKNVPVMHACGHDMHMSVWTGVARIIAQLKDQWKGTVVFIAQPAEEVGLGALQMIEDGLFSKMPAPDFLLALHVNSAVEAGKIGFCPAYSLANIDLLDITVKGKGGHSASPYTTIDPVLMASKMVVAFHDIITREVPAVQPAVISVGALHGGTNGNIIPSEVKMEVSVRALDDNIHKKLLASIKRTCEGIAMASGVAPADYPLVETRKPGSEAVYNDPALCANLADYLKTVVGNDNVLLLGPEMFGEDFSRYGRYKPGVPSVLYSLGAVKKEDMLQSQAGQFVLPSTHSPFFIPDTEITLKTGILSMSSAILHLLISSVKKQ